jgi:hypothetical protein
VEIDDVLEMDQVICVRSEKIVSDDDVLEMDQISQSELKNRE